MKKVFISLMVVALVFSFSTSLFAKDSRDYYVIRFYHCSTSEQINRLDDYLKNVYLPFLHNLGYTKVGVFEPLENDTAQDKKLMVWFPISKLDELLKINAQYEKLDPFGKDPLIYTEGEATKELYNRYETMLTVAYKFHKQYQKESDLVKSPNRIYEYRSYESKTEQLHLNKVHMFNEGKEIDIFKKLNFNAIFYSRVILGSRMPNLIYMTSFNSLDDRNEHWKKFGSDPDWMRLVKMDKYQNNMSRNETILMRAKEYADF